MSRRIIVTAIISTALASSAAATAASAALPEFTVTSSFKGSGGAAVLKTESGSEIKCTAKSSKGNATGSTKIATETVTLTGCTATILGKAEKCQSGATKEEIVSAELESTLGYVDEAQTIIGVLLKAKAGITSNLFEF